jgi:hypothetical protein
LTCSSFSAILHSKYKKTETTLLFQLVFTQMFLHFNIVADKIEQMLKTNRRRIHVPEALPIIGVCIGIAFVLIAIFIPVIRRLGGNAISIERALLAMQSSPLREDRVWNDEGYSFKFTNGLVRVFYRDTLINGVKEEIIEINSNLIDEEGIVLYYKDDVPNQWSRPQNPSRKKGMKPNEAQFAQAILRRIQEELEPA